MKKKIYVVFNDQEKIYVSETLSSNLKFVFEDYIDIIACFLDKVKPADIADGDLFLVLYDNRVNVMKNYISSLDKVIVMSRTVQRKFLPEIFSIPKGTEVLVVNDSDKSTLETVNTLYRLGLNFLNLVPYLSSKERSPYEHIKVAITPDEAETVPGFIEKIINIKNRYLDVSTIIEIIARLDLNNERITENLLKYSQIVAESNKGRNYQYVSSYLKNEMLKSIIDGTEEAVILTDKLYSVEYANRKACGVFGDVLEGGGNLQEILKDYFPRFAERENYNDELLNIGGVNYLAKKNAVNYADQLIGYSFILNNEQDIKNVGEILNKNLSKTGLVAKYSFDSILCVSPKMKKCIEFAKKFALTDYTILITGESGTGKELIAQSIHNYSKRKNHPFVAINCAALPESLLESELFGYVKGAFTGASKNGKTGLFEQADQGTIFLDEIGDMSLSLQARLLRVLQEKQIMRLGSDKVISVDIRIIAATNKELTTAIAGKKFREDLYFRLCSIPVEVPPLRDRKGDALYLFQKFLGDKCDSLTDEEKCLIENCPWHGNVRELINAVNYYSILKELPASLKGAGTCRRLGEDSGGNGIKLRALDIIKENTSENSGVGRTSILYKLKECGLHISDDKLRKILRELEEEGKIAIGKGRKGCMAKL